jgi:hypothetical protein
LLPAHPSAMPGIVRQSDDRLGTFGKGACHRGSSITRVRRWKLIFDWRGGQRDIRLSPVPTSARRVILSI